MTTITTTRRAILAGAAVLPALAVPAFSTGDDAGLIAAIRRYHLASEAQVYAQGSGLPEKDWDAFDVICSAETSTMVDVLAYKPTTLAGCVAMLRCIQSFTDINDDGLLGGWSEELSDPASTLLGSIAAVIEAQAKAVQS